MSRPAPRLRQTKIVATAGPACDAPETLVELLRAGVDVVRLNLSHGTHAEHAARIERVRAAAAELAVHVAVMVDTRGAEIRLGAIEGDDVELAAGAPFVLYGDDRVGDAKGASLSVPGLAEELQPGDDVLLDDGRVALRVDRPVPGGVRCSVLHGGRLRSHKGVNVPGARLGRRGLPASARADLAFAARHGADYVAASFVEHGDEVRAIHGLLEEHGTAIPVIAKIESRAGVDDLEGIVAAADGVMVARGDLGVELPVEDVPILQKRIIRTTVMNGKPVITATQMLDSMERSPRPTRAEASDVANAILDGTSAVMLSGETAIGAHPLEAVRTMARLARRAEAGLAEFGVLQHILPKPSTVVTEAVSQAATSMAGHLEAGAIVTLTETGFTARSVSKYRPPCPILAVSGDERVVRRLALNWGVVPLHVRGDPAEDARVAFALGCARERGILAPGDVAVVTIGHSRRAGSTDGIRVVPVVD